MSDTTTTPATQIAFPDIADAPKTRAARKDGKPSIREICLTGIAMGKSTASITAVLKDLHPESAAAEKASKHIAWYRAWAKKHGNPYAVTATPAAE